MKKHPSKTPWLACLSLLYPAMRPPQLMQTPGFIDEAIHVDFAKAPAAMCGDWRTGMNIGKWLSIQCHGMVFRFSSDTLRCARLVPVVLGLVTVCVIFATGRSGPERYRTVRAAGWTGALLYIVEPYALFHDRQALT